VKDEDRVPNNLKKTMEVERTREEVYFIEIREGPMHTKAWA